MGCDIHGTIERYDGNKWVMIEHLSYHSAALERNYERFGWLANVRSTSEAHPEPKGIPDDASEGTLYHINSWDNDGHSHSWHGLVTTAQIFAKTEYRDKTWADVRLPARNQKKVNVHRVIEDIFGLYMYKGPNDEPIDLLQLEAEYRFVFWFDN